MSITFFTSGPQTCLFKCLNMGNAHPVEVKLHSLQSRCTALSRCMLYGTLDEALAFIVLTKRCQENMRLTEFATGATPLYVTIHKGWFRTSYTLLLRYKGVYGVATYEHSNLFEEEPWLAFSLSYDGEATALFRTQLRNDCETAEVPDLWSVMSQHLPSSRGDFVCNIITCICAQGLVRFCKCNYPFLYRQSTFGIQ